jgi:NAD(P)H-dependent FMN reductase
MKKIIALGASNSTKSINRRLAGWAAAQLENAEVNLLDLNDFEMPIFSVEREHESGIPDKAHQFKNALREADGIIISFAEYNGSYTAAFKNIYDWISRIGRPIWSDKPMFLLATSPGPRGAVRVLSTAKSAFPGQGGKVVASFSLPSFNQNFIPDKGIVESDLNTEFEKQLQNFEMALWKSDPVPSPSMK